MRTRGNGSGCVTSYMTAKNKKRWRVRVTIGTKFDEDGNVKFVSRSLGTFATKAEAEKALASYNDSPYDLEKKVTTVGELYAVWSEYYFERVARSSVRTVTSAWKYCEGISNLSLKKLNKGHIEDVMNKGYILIPNGVHKGEKRYASACTKCRIKSMFNLMLDYAYDRNLVVKNVARTFDVNDMRKEAGYSRKIKQPFTDEEIELLWKWVDKVEKVDMILLGIYSGFRPQELCNLKLENVDLDGNQIVGGMKTPAGTDRVVPIHPLVKPLVEKAYREAVEFGSIWLFNKRKGIHGEHLTYDMFRRAFERAMAELGIEGKTGHCPRVTFVTKCYSAGVPEHIVKRIIGHSLGFTDGVYNRVSFDELYDNICKICR